MKRLELWGAILTVAYLSLMGWWLAQNWSAFLCLKLNELGDFLAGTFGPIAFLWLVLGFLQQGRELKLSTNALELQVKELKNSVDQQVKMGAVADLQQDEIRRSYDADFQLEVHHVSGGDKRTFSVQLIIKNHGADARNVKLEFEPQAHDPVFNCGDIKCGKEIVVHLYFGSGRESYSGVATVSYIGRDKIERKDLFECYFHVLAREIKVERLS